MDAFRMSRLWNQLCDGPDESHFRLSHCHRGVAFK